MTCMVYDTYNFQFIFRWDKPTYNWKAAGNPPGSVFAVFAPRSAWHCVRHPPGEVALRRVAKSRKRPEIHWFDGFPDSSWKQTMYSIYLSI